MANRNQRGDVMGMHTTTAMTKGDCGPELRRLEGGHGSRLPPAFNSAGALKCAALQSAVCRTASACFGPARLSAAAPRSSQIPGSNPRWSPITRVSLSTPPQSLIDAPAFDGLVRGRPAGRPEGTARLGIDALGPELHRLIAEARAVALIASVVPFASVARGLEARVGQTLSTPPSAIRCPPDLLGETAEVGRAKVMRAPRG